MNEMTRECLLLLYTMHRYTAALDFENAHEDWETLVIERQMERAFLLLLDNEPERAIAEISESLSLRRPAQPDA